MSEFSEDDADLLSPKVAALAAKENQPAPAAATEEKPVQLPAEVAPAGAAPQPGATVEQKAVTVKAPSLEASSHVQLIVPRNLEEVYKIARGFVLAQMVPDSLQLWTEGEGGRVLSSWEAKKNPRAFYNEEKTTARVALVILKGTEVGFGPASAVSTIMLVNNKPSIYGDGAKALVLRSGLIEYEKTEIKGERFGKDYSCTVTLKRKDHSEAVSRTFSYADAERAKLTSKPGPWIDYPERQCYWRAWTFAARDVASDALYGLSVYEEQIDLVEQQRRAGQPADLKSLA